MSQVTEPVGGQAQPLVEHLLELRRRLVWALMGIALCFFAIVPFAQPLYAFVAKPLMAVLPATTSMIATDVIAPFFVPIKVALMAAFLVSLPNTLYQIWAFVAPALYQHLVCRRHGVLLLSCVPRGVQIFRRHDAHGRFYGNRY